MDRSDNQSARWSAGHSGSSGIVLSLRLDRGSGASLAQQIFSGIQELILSGGLHPGQRLPSTRVLADELGVSRNTVMQVFEQLVTEGYIHSQVGAGSRVSDELPDTLPVWSAAKGRPTGPAEALISSRARGMSEMAGSRSYWLPAFSPGMPGFQDFPFPAWSRLLAEEWREPGMGAMPSDPGGYWPLRESIAQYVRTARGVQCESDQVIILSGNREATTLAAQVVMDSGDRAIVENPGYPGTWSALAAAGVHAVPLRVDSEGFDFSQLGPAHEGARAICVAPSHQFPLGGTTTLPRRLELLEWARRKQVWVIEDDYDSEFRYAERPLPSLQSLDPTSNIIYIGSFSKVLFPALRLGYAIVPKAIIQPFLQMKMAASGPTSLIGQRAVHRFFETQMFYRHMRTMRKLYQQRRKALERVLREILPEITIAAQQEAGLFLTVLFGPDASDVDDQAIAREALSQGLHVEPLSKHYLQGPYESGLIIGFGALDAEAFAAPVQRLAKVIRSRLAGSRPGRERATRPAAPQASGATA